MNKPVQWTNLNPTELLDNMKKMQFASSFPFKTLEDHMKRAGITNGYQSKPCLNPSDPECPETAPNKKSQKVRFPAHTMHPRRRGTDSRLEVARPVGGEGRGEEEGGGRERQNCVTLRYSRPRTMETFRVCGICSLAARRDKRALRMRGARLKFGNARKSRGFCSRYSNRDACVASKSRNRRDETDDASTDVGATRHSSSARLAS